jgi:hypothetical protein
VQHRKPKACQSPNPQPYQKPNGFLTFFIKNGGCFTIGDALIIVEKVLNKGVKVSIRAPIDQKITRVQDTE